MSDLRTDRVRMAEFLAHLKERESVVSYFYCDHRGLVTVGVGFLVDQDGAPDATGLALATRLAQRPAIRFRRSANGVLASTADVEADWQRVKNYGRSHPGIGSAQYAAIAQLRLESASITTLLSETIGPWIDRLYRKKPFMLSFDPRVVMALVDVRFNPAGIQLYGNVQEIPQLWAALDPGDADFNLGQAVVLFERIWAHRATARYGYRHWLRVQWFRAGIGAMGGPNAPRSG